MGININISKEKDNLFNISKEELLEGLDEYQYAAVTYDNNSNLLCNAIAGSGKTHVLTTKVAWLIANNVKPTSIMLLTFTNKAAKEMLERVSMKFNNAPIGVKAGTFHSIASKYLRKYPHSIGYKNNFTILDQNESRELISQLRKKYMEENGFDKDQKKEFIKAVSIQNIYTKMINLRQPLSYMNIPKGQYKAVESILLDYKRTKFDAQLMDFDDLLVNFNKILDDDFVRKEIQEEIKYVLIDEYQDINYLQDSIIEKISNKENVFAVGDPSQSIYAFRGSDISYIENFTKNYKCEEINLKKNYRSDKNVLQLAQNAINKNPQKKKVEMVPFRDTDYQQNLEEYYNVFGEINNIVERIENLIEAGISKKEIAILIRSTGKNTFMLEAAIRKANIPYELRAGFSYFNKAHIKDVVSMLTLMVNPKCIVSFQRTMSLLEGVGAKTSDKIYEFYKENDFSFNDCLDNIDQLNISGMAKRSFIDICKVFIHASSVKQVKAKIEAITIGFYFNYLEKKYGDDDDYDERFKEVMDLPTITDAVSLIDFLEDISLDSESLENKDGSQDKVIISTMHRSKGLEWDYVFVPFLTIGYFPKKLDDQEELEEERRLFYVTLTRARKQLFLSYSEFDTNYNQLAKSIFLTDMLK